MFSVCGVMVGLLVEAEAPELEHLWVIANDQAGTALHHGKAEYGDLALRISHAPETERCIALGLVGGALTAGETRPSASIALIISQRTGDPFPSTKVAPRI